jgi:uncharacterized protein (TIGR03435 family)
MNPKKKDIDRFLETYIPSPSIEDMETDSARVLRRLKSENRPVSSGSSSSTPQGDSVMKVSRAWWQPAAAAVLIATVGIGLYAAQRSGFFSPRQVVPPTAQSPAPSVKPSVETTQIAVITPGSTKPGAALSREEILAGVAAQIAAAQATDAGAVRPKFAVASVRPVPISPLINNGFKCLGVDGLWGILTARQASTPQGRCVGDVVNLGELVYYAYSSYSGPPIAEWPITGMPRDVEILWLQINAAADNPERVTRGELRLMVRTLLEDRFKARVHLETRELDGYVLTIGKSGIKFKETSNDAACNGPGGGGPISPVIGPRGSNIISLRGKCHRMGTVTGFLSRNALDRLSVADKTGLTGTYDIDFTLEFAEGFAPVAQPRGGGGGGAPQPRQFVTPAAKALEDQLGLHLERGKVPVEYVVVDHIEQPTEN